jgi:hypothetical protein
MVGRHRRIKLIALINYRSAMAKESQAAREEITRAAEKYG